MSLPKDLTRWNRAGLNRFRYIDGNAATYLELLRYAFVNAFRDWEDVASGGSDVETDPENLARQYHEKREDWAWELARVLARSSHILTEYIDAYANEGFLTTASQWDNVRRLVEMLDYHPAPPASASTPLVIEAKEDTAGPVAAGFQVKYSPEDGSRPVIFETLADITLDAALNSMRPAEYDRNQEPLQGNLLVLDGIVNDMEIGEPLVLEDERTGLLLGYLVTGVNQEGQTTRIHVRPRLSRQMMKGYVKVHVRPEERLQPLGPAAKGAEIRRVLRLREKAEGLQPGMVVWISDGKKACFRRLLHVHGQRLIFAEEIGSLRIDRARIGRPVTMNVNRQVERPVVSNETIIYVFRAAGDWSRLSGQRIADSRQDAQGKKYLPFYTVTAARYHPVDPKDPHSGYTLLTIAWRKKDHPFPLSNPQALLVPPAGPGDWMVDSYLEKVSGHLPTTIICEKSKKTSAGDLAIVVSGRQMAWARLGSVAVDTEQASATLSAAGSWADRGGGDFFLRETGVHCHFKKVMRLVHWQENSRWLYGNRIPLASAPECLEKGRALLVERIDDPGASFLTTITQVKNNVLCMARSLPAGFTHGNCVMTANVVPAGHGETRKEEVLGSGDATRSSQSFIFAQDQVAFVADPSQPAGVRAAIAIRVEGRTWQQVDRLKNSGPADPHYTVRMTEQGYLKIIFGDGVHGRRLPTGSNNVRITWRAGSGLEGNLAAGSLDRPVRDHHLVKGVRQPLAATGGNDMESITSLKENAPATVLTLERAVSLTDFSCLAMSQSSVWQARAFTRPTGPGRNEKIEVVVVPAGGGSLGDLAGTLRNFLQEHAIPGVDIRILPCQPRSFTLEVQLSIDTGYDPEEVQAVVKSSLATSFSLRRRKLGQDLFLSEIYKTVEAVPGVQHSQIIINGEEALQRMTADDKEVLILERARVIYGNQET